MLRLTWTRSDLQGRTVSWRTQGSPECAPNTGQRSFLTGTAWQPGRTVTLGTAEHCNCQGVLGRGSCCPQGWQGQGVALVAGRQSVATHEWLLVAKKMTGSLFASKTIIHTTILDSNQHHHCDDCQWIHSLPFRHIDLKSMSNICIC